MSKNLPLKVHVLSTHKKLTVHTQPFILQDIILHIEHWLLKIKQHNEAQLQYCKIFSKQIE